MAILVLITSPMFAVIVALVGLIREKDWFWAFIALIVLAIVVSGAVLAAL